MEKICHISYLNKENICAELREFITPFATREAELFKMFRERKQEGRKWWSASLPNLTIEPGFDLLSDLAKNQYYDHCNRWELIDVLASDGEPIDPKLYEQSIS